MADILIADVTNGTLDASNNWVGTGVFDKLVNAVNKNIEGQYNKGRITGSDYAQVYLSSLQTVISQSIQYALQEKVAEAQIDLYTRQKNGFDDDAKQKLLKILMDTWAVAYSTAPDAASIPDAIKIAALDKITENAMTSLGILESVDLGTFNSITA